MRQKPRSASFLTAALTALLVNSLSGAAGLVLCLGADGHRAIELEHGAIGCPTLASSRGATGVSAQPQGKCIDVPSAGTALMTAPSSDKERVPMPPVAFAVPVQQPMPWIEMRPSASADARAGPSYIEVRLRSTVLLV